MIALHVAQEFVYTLLCLSSCNEYNGCIICSPAAIELAGHKK